MSEYKINYYHADSLVGHFYVEFDGPALTDKELFGKNPAIPLMPIAAGKVIDESEIHSDEKAKKILVSTSVTREQFESAYQFAVDSLKNGGVYHGTLDNCVDFNQRVFAASGGQGHFINLFPKAKLEAAGTLASNHVMQYYESSSFKSVTGLDGDLVAAKYGVSKDRVVENYNSNLDLMGRPTLSKTFTIMPEKTSSTNTPNRDSGIFINNQANHFANPIFNNYQPSHLSQPLFSQPSFMRSNYIHEPSWLYTRPSIMSNGLDDFMKYQQAKQEFQSLVWSCLNNDSCRETTSSLADKAVSSAYSSSLFVPFSIKLDFYSSVSSAAMGWSSLSSVSLSRTGYNIGSWTHPLRSELKYAASHVSPLVLDLNGDGIKLLPYTKGVYFDIDNDGFMEKVGWVSPEDGQIARDLNGNGEIDNIAELFGDDLISAYFKLSLMDDNNDKVIDQQDKAYGELLIWQDKNSNGFSEPDELRGLKEAGIQSISLVTKPDDRVIEGNTISETSSFTFVDGRIGEVADVHYHNDDMDSWYKGDHDQANIKMLNQHKNNKIKEYQVFANTMQLEKILPKEKLSEFLLTELA